MARSNRRSILKLAGGAAVAAKTTGLAGILASGTAPAFGQTTTVHLLRWNDFVPASDTFLRQTLLPAAEKAAWRKAMRPLYQEYEGIVGKDTLQAIEKTVAQSSKKK